MTDAAGPNRANRLYINNLAWRTSWQDLKDFIRDEGFEPTRVDVFHDASGRSRGCGIVAFNTPEEAADAIGKLNEKDLHGRPIYVREDRDPESRPRTEGAPRERPSYSPAGGRGGSYGTRDFGDRENRGGEYNRSYGRGGGGGYDRERGYGGDRGYGRGGDRDGGYGGDRDRSYGGGDRGYGADRAEYSRGGDYGRGGDRDYDRDRGYGGGRGGDFSRGSPAGGRGGRGGFGASRGFGGGRGR